MASNPNTKPFTVVIPQTSGSINSSTGDYPFVEIQLSGSNLNLQTDSSGNLVATKTGIFTTVSASTISAATLSSSNAWHANLNASQSTFYTTNITSTLNATDYNVGALTVAGGAAIDLDLFVGGNSTILGDTTIAGNLNVLGTSSIVDISSSTLIIGANRIKLNAFSPSTVSQRWAGIDIVDSGSFNNNVTSSLLWDSSNNYWLLMSDQTGPPIVTSSAIILMGPSSMMGNELVPTANNFLKAQNSYGNLTSSNLSEINGVLQYSGPATFLNITASLNGTSSWSNNSLTASSLSFQVSTASFANTASYLVPGNAYTVGAFNANGLSTLSAVVLNGTGSFNSAITITDKSQSPNDYTLGSITTQGGLGVAKHITVGGNVYVAGFVSASLGITASLNGTSSWAQNSVNSLTASFLPINTYQITASNANNALTASSINFTASNSVFSQTASSANSLNAFNSYTVVNFIAASITASYFSGSYIGNLTGTSSWASNSINSATASYLPAGTYYFTSSNSINAISASYVDAGNITTGTLNNLRLPSQINITGITASLNGTSSNAILSSTASSLNFQVATASFATSSLTASYLTPGNNYTVQNITTSGTMLLKNSVLFDYSGSSTVGTSSVLIQSSTGSYVSAFFDYAIFSGSNSRAGTLIANWNGGTIRYSEHATLDIGSTSQISMSAILSTGSVQLIVNASSSNWNIRAAARYL
jgi:hypothetical protein